MKKYLKTIIALIPFLLFLPALSLAGQFKVTRVYDGDTVKAQGHDITIKVRLAGIDAPETSKQKGSPGQPFSQKAKNHLTSLILNKNVDIKGYDLGPYNRVLGVIYLDDKDINLEMIKAGLAEVYRGKSPKGFDLRPYLQAEANARKHGIGIWSLGEEYISPKDWRKMEKAK